MNFQDDEKKRPVLQDVADCVGVTKMTVSRFLVTRNRFPWRCAARLPPPLMNWVTSQRRPRSSLPPAVRWASCFLP
ncbi:LacI family DNA-binding transcriptional regulator [Shigella flexneri]